MIYVVVLKLNQNRKGNKRYFEVEHEHIEEKFLHLTLQQRLNCKCISSNKKNLG